MKNDKYIQSINMIEPDAAALERMLDKIHTRAKSGDVSKARSINSTIKWIAPLAACIMIVVAIAVPTLLNHGLSLGEIKSSGSVASLDDCKGLPAGDYTWTEGAVEGISASRVWIGELRHLFYFFENAYGKEEVPIVSAIAIVKVQTVQATPGNAWSEKGQIASCEVVYDNILENSRQLPEFPQIKQYLYGGCTDDEETNLLRVGGVYVLPLTLYGYVEIIDDVLRMRWKDLEWYAEDTQGFSAKIVDDIITIETEEFNVFRPFEGKTVAEMNTAIEEIKQYLGIA
jgi:hypothetical protein